MFDPLDPFKALDALVAEIRRLREAHALLEQVWEDLDPYHTGSISESTHTKLNNFFGFDDSE